MLPTTDARPTPAIMLGLLKKESDRRKAETSLYEFFKQAWPIVEPGVPFIDSWHLRVVCEHLEAITHRQIQRLLANFPPRHTKSTAISVVWPMWEWIDTPQEKYLCASYSGVLSIRDNLKARRLVTSPWYQERWADKFELSGDQNAKQRYENNQTGYRIATSVGGSATGEGGTRLILDDPHSAQEAQSDALRETALEWFDMVWSTRLNNPKTDAMVVVMQRLHEQDISGHILDDLRGWEHICIPAEYDGVKRKTVLGYYDPREVKGELICPERFGRKEIDALKVLLGVYGSSGQLQQDPTPPGGGILRTSFFKLWPHTSNLPSFEYVLQSYDSAFTEKQSGDPTTCTVWAIFTYENARHAMLIDAWDEHLTYPEMKKRVVKDWGLEYGGTTQDTLKKTGPYTRSKRPDRILIEEKASGQSLLQDLRMSNVPIVGYNPGKADKIARAHMAAPILEAGVLWIPESSKTPGHPVSWAVSFMKQLAKFPKMSHDDYVDTFSQAIIYFKNDGFFDILKAKDHDPDEKPRQKGKINPYAA